MWPAHDQYECSSGCIDRENYFVVVTSFFFCLIETIKLSPLKLKMIDNFKQNQKLSKPNYKNNHEKS
jgi:hypothetical protein